MGNNLPYYWSYKTRKHSLQGLLGSESSLSNGGIRDPKLINVKNIKDLCDIRV